MDLHKSTEMSNASASSPYVPDGNRLVERWYDWVRALPNEVILDGGLGSELESRGYDLSTELWTGSVLVTDPTKLANVAHAWLVAGADIVTTATYQITQGKLQNQFKLTEEAASEAVRISVKTIHETCAEFWKQHCQQRGDERKNRRKITEGEEVEMHVNRRYPKIALSMGPLIATLPQGSEYTAQYDDSVTPDTLHDFHLSRTKFLYNSCGETPPDILAFETIGCVAEAEAIARAMTVPETRNFPYWVSLQCRDDGHLASGEDIAPAILGILRECITNNIVAIGINCVDIMDVSTLVKSVQRTIDSFFTLANAEQHRSGSPVQVIAYPNSGEHLIGKTWSWPADKPLPPSGWAAVVHNTKAHLIGGCCRTGLTHIRALHDKVSRSLIGSIETTK